VGRLFHFLCYANWKGGCSAQAEALSRGKACGRTRAVGRVKAGRLRLTVATRARTQLTGQRRPRLERGSPASTCGDRRGREVSHRRCDQVNDHARRQRPSIQGRYAVAGIERWSERNDGHAAIATAMAQPGARPSGQRRARNSGARPTRG
jgi:hypothetical protein